MVLDVIAQRHDLPPVTPVNEADGVSHAQGGHGDGRPGQKQIGLAFRRLALDTEPDGLGGPGLESLVLQNKQVEAGITGMEMAVVGVELAGSLTEGFDVQMHGRGQVSAWAPGDTCFKMGTQ